MKLTERAAEVELLLVHAEKAAAEAVRSAPYNEVRMGCYTALAQAYASMAQVHATMYAADLSRVG